MDPTHSSDEKLQIMRFVCAFAWADLKVVNEERTLIERFSNALELDATELQQVNDWIIHPPRPEEIDPFDIPTHLKSTILSAASAISIIDGDLDNNEVDLLVLLRSILGIEEELFSEGNDEPKD